VGASALHPTGSGSYAPAAPLRNKPALSSAWRYSASVRTSTRRGSPTASFLRVNGVDVIPLVEAELDRRFPGRAGLPIGLDAHGRPGAHADLDKALSRRPKAQSLSPPGA
jgi:hypothetical protein